MESKQLTIIIGPNSSGKSSILQSILLLKKLHLNQGSVPTTELFNIEGYINMGSWDHLAFDEDSPMSFSLLVGDGGVSFEYDVSINRDGRLSVDGELQVEGVASFQGSLWTDLPCRERLKALTLTLRASHSH